MKQKRSVENAWENILLFVFIFVFFLPRRVTLSLGKLEHTGGLAVFEVIYQTRKSMPDHISKHREESWKYDTKRSFFLTNFEVFGNLVKYSLDVCQLEEETNSDLELDKSNFLIARLG